MNKERILLKLVMDEIGLRLKLDTFPDRLILQKKLYLVQAAGLDLGYRYNWYLKGPYSPSLTADAFLLEEEIASNERDYTEYELAERARDQALRATGVWELPEGQQIEPDLWLELLSSVHYLKNTAYWPKKEGVTFDDVFARLIRSKPHLSGQRGPTQRAWNQLVSTGLIEDCRCG